jgi:hypothetical protein
LRSNIQFKSRLPKAKHGRTLPAYWASVLAAVRRTRCANTTPKVFCRSSANSIGAASIRHQLLPRWRPARRRTNKRRPRYRHQVSQQHDIHITAGVPKELCSFVGSSNSQDSFPAPPGSTGGGSMDGYPGYPGGYPPPGATQDYNQQPMQRPPIQSNAQSPHAGESTYHDFSVFLIV